MIERFEFAELGAENIRLENWLSTPRHGMALPLGDAPPDVELDENGEPLDGEGAPESVQRMLIVEPCSIHLAQQHMGHSILIHALVDGQTVEILCDIALVQDMAAHVFGPIDQSLLASRERAMLLEHAMGQPIEILERDFGCAVTFQWATPDAPSDLPQIGAVMLRLDERSRPGYALLHGNKGAADLFRRWVDSCELHPALTVSPLVSVSFVYGGTTLSLSDLRGLSVGDTVLIDEKFQSDRPLRAIAGAMLMAEARFAGQQQIEAISLFARVPQDPTLRWMIEPFEGVPIDMSDTANLATNQLGDMKVKLVFEIGRLEISVADLERVGPGHVFQVSRAIDGNVDVIAGGRVIGSGELVKIGDDVGVRLKRIAS